MALVHYVSAQNHMTFLPAGWKDTFVIPSL